MNRFQKKVLDVQEQYLTPVFTESGITYVWIKHNNIFSNHFPSTKTNNILEFILC